MKVLKRLAVPVAAMLLLGLMSGCQQPLSAGDGAEFGAAGLSRKDRRELERKRERESANAQLTDGMLRASNILMLTQNGLQLKLQGNASLDAAAAPTEVAAAADDTTESVSPSEQGVQPAPGAEEVAPAEEAAPADGEAAPADGEAAPEGDATMGAEVEGQAAAAPVDGPQMPELLAQGALAIKVIDQAYAALTQLEADMAGLFNGAFKDEPRVMSLRELMDAAGQLILVAARMDPVNADVIGLEEAKLAEAQDQGAEPSEGEAVEPAAADSAEGEPATEGAAADSAAPEGEGELTDQPTSEGDAQAAPAEESKPAESKPAETVSH